MTEQDKAGWERPWPQDGEHCPECGHGLLEVQEFGSGPVRDVWAFCGGLNGCSREDADEDNEEEMRMCGCGWTGRYQTEGHEP